MALAPVYRRGGNPHQIHQVRPGSVTHDRLASWVWVTHDHWMPVTPGAVSEVTRTDLAPVP